MLLGRRRRRLTEAVASPWREQHAREVFSYEIRTLHFLDQDTLLWQTPTLALTAQAFLLTIALGGGTSPAARTAAASLGVVISALSIQLLVKHHALSEDDKERLSSLEEVLGLPPLARREKEDGSHFVRFRGIARLKSHRLWIAGFSIFALVDLLVVPVAWVWPGVLEVG